MSEQVTQQPETANQEIAQPSAESQVTAQPTEQVEQKQPESAPVNNEVKAEAEAEAQEWKELYNDNENKEDSTEPAPDPDDTVPTEYNFEGIDQTTKGTKVTIEDKALVTNIAKKLNLTTRQAKLLLDEGGTLIAEHTGKTLDAQAKAWYDQVKADPKLGGVNMESTKANIQKVMKHYGSKELTALLNNTRLGFHPLIVQMFNSIGQEMREDQGFVNSASGERQREESLRRLYNNSPDLQY